MGIFDNKEDEIKKAIDSALKIAAQGSRDRIEQLYEKSQVHIQGISTGIPAARTVYDAFTTRIEAELGMLRKIRRTQEYME